MSKNQKETGNQPEREKGDVKPQNQHYNIRKQALGPNGKR